MESPGSKQVSRLVLNDENICKSRQREHSVVINDKYILTTSFTQYSKCINPIGECFTGLFDCALLFLKSFGV